MSDFEGIEVKGAREHNLKNVNLRIPRNQITVITGLSGSGKSSIAFDTVYAEGQRRYVEGLSAYARNFLEQLKKPEVDSITGLSPAIAIDQKSVGHNPRSTVGTVTEIYDYLRLLFAKVGVPHCPMHQIPVQGKTTTEIVEAILAHPENSRIHLLAPMATQKKGEFHNEFQKWLKLGYVRAKIDGQYVELEQQTKLAKNKAHDIDILVDRLVIKADIQRRLSESVQAAIQLTGGSVIIESTAGERVHFSTHSSCPICFFSFPEIEPRYFSFNNPRGACPTCRGLGQLFDSVEEEFDTEENEDDGTEESQERKTQPCPDCGGTRLRTEVLNVLVDGRNIAEFAHLSASELFGEIKHLKLPATRQVKISEKICAQILSRLDFMIRVGTDYLSLDRPMRTLSGGESQRVRLATQVGSSLIGVLYVLDEPSIGLHPRDHQRLLEILRELRDLGNTVLLVEHDEETIRSADYVIDVGPRAGRLGGEIVATGTPEEIVRNSRSLTGQFLSGEQSISSGRQRRPGNSHKLKLFGATGNNLKNVDLELPLGTLISVTGVSGSGKSTLIIDTLHRALMQHFYSSTAEPAPFRGLEGLQHIDKVIEISQRPIGRTPRSNPASYVGVLPMIREVYARLPESRLRGYKPGRFSFNLKGGRCENCQGAGMLKVEMHFMANVYVPCDVCQTKRYNRETLNVRYREKSIADVLAMTVAEAVEFFKNHLLIQRKLEALHQTGLDYLTLGQSSTTLSGGEAQRVKLSRELSKRSTGRTLYILDEPTTGLHFADVRELINLLQGLVDQGNTVLVIEHQLDVIKSSDFVVDLGPEGGAGGGRIIASGTPEEIAQSADSHTGRFLHSALRP